MKDKTVHKELGDRIERAITASSLEAEQDSEAQIRFETASKQSNDTPLSRVNTLGSRDDNMKLKELMDLCTKLPEKFWNTTTTRTLDNGEMEITATIDGKVKISSEASIRRHIKLEDSYGISNLPTTENFKQLALMGHVSNSDKLTFQKGHFSPQWRTYIAPTLTQKLFSNMRRASKSYTGVDIPLFPTMLIQGLVVQDEGSTVLVESPTQTNVADEAASTGVDVRHGGDTTTVTSLDAGQGSGNIDKTPTMPYDSPLPRVHILRKVQKMHEHDIESDFEFTAAEEVYTAKKEVSTAEPVSTTGASVSTAGASSAKDKGKTIMEEAKTIQTKKKFSLNIEEWDDIQARVEADEEFAQRLQSEKREMYSKAEKARLLAELINERNRYFAAQRAEEMRNRPLIQAQQRTYMSQYIKNMGSHKLK
ncbi:hypothetical protein Tco_0996485 [Tanacetum coccineum]